MRMPEFYDMGGVLTGVRMTQGPAGLAQELEGIKTYNICLDYEEVCIISIQLDFLSHPGLKEKGSS